MMFETLYTTMVERCSHETAFNKEEAEALYNLLHTLPNGSNVVEIGVEFGRSTTVIGQVAKEKNFNFWAIDAWVGEYSNQAKAHIENVLIGEWGLPITLWSFYSSMVAKAYSQPINLIHIDGDHTYHGVFTDCVQWLPKVVSGGYACFDDYGHDSLPDVYKAVQDYMDSPQDWIEDVGNWNFVGRYGNKLGVFQKI